MHIPPEPGDDATIIGVLQNLISKIVKADWANVGRPSPVIMGLPAPQHGFIRATTASIFSPGLS